MRKSIPLKTLRKLIAASVFSIVLISLSTPCFAAHRKKAPPPPPPAPVVTPDPEPIVSFGTFALIILAGGLGVWVFFLKKEETNMRERIKKLGTALTFETTTNESLERKLEIARSEAKTHSANLDRARNEVTQGIGQIQKLKTRIENILLVDPEVEAKALALLNERAKAAAETKEKEEALALQMKVKTQGKAQLEQLLSDMRRGY